MILDILATLVLLVFFANHALVVRESWRDGFAWLWVAVGALQAASLLIPLVAVWL